MSDNRLPPLPEPAYGDCDVVKNDDMSGAYTAGQMRERDRQTVELCAKACWAQGRKAATLDGESFYIATGQCAAAILDLLKDTP